MTNHSISDLITRIKNGYMAQKIQIESPYSMMREQILAKLKKLGYVKDYRFTEDTIKQIIIDLNYENDVPAVTDVKIYSTPGKRWYSKVKDLKPVLGGYGYAILTTPKGIMTHIEAKKNNIGGELLFAIW